MKLVSFEDKNRIKLGAVIGDQILDLHATSASDYLLGMIEFLEGEHDAFATASLAIETAQKAPEESVWAEHARLLPPVPNPKKFLLLAEVEVVVQDMVVEEEQEDWFIKLLMH